MQPSTLVRFADDDPNAMTAYDGLNALLEQSEMQMVDNLRVSLARGYKKQAEDLKTLPSSMHAIHSHQNLPVTPTVNGQQDEARATRIAKFLERHRPPSANPIAAIQSKLAQIAQQDANSINMLNERLEQSAKADHQALAQLSRKVREIEEQSSRLFESLASDIRMVQQEKDKWEAMHQRLDALMHSHADDYARLKQQLSNELLVQKGTQSSITQLENKFRQAQAELCQLQKRLSHLQTGLVQSHAAIAENDRQIQLLQKNLIALETSIQELKKRRSQCGWLLVAACVAAVAIAVFVPPAGLAAGSLGTGVAAGEEIALGLIFSGGEISLTLTTAGAAMATTVMLASLSSKDSEKAPKSPPFPKEAEAKSPALAYVPAPSTQAPMPREHVRAIATSISSPNIEDTLKAASYKITPLARPPSSFSNPSSSHPSLWEVLGASADFEERHNMDVSMAQSRLLSVGLDVISYPVEKALEFAAQELKTYGSQLKTFGTLFCHAHPKVEAGCRKVESGYQHVREEVQRVYRRAAGFVAELIDFNAIGNSYQQGLQLLAEDRHQRLGIPHAKTLQYADDGNKITGHLALTTTFQAAGRIFGGMKKMAPAERTLACELILPRTGDMRGIFAKDVTPKLPLLSQSARVQKNRELRLLPSGIKTTTTKLLENALRKPVAAALIIRSTKPTSGFTYVPYSPTYTYVLPNKGSLKLEAIPRIEPHRHTIFDNPMHHLPKGIWPKIPAIFSILRGHGKYTHIEIDLRDNGTKTVALIRDLRNINTGEKGHLHNTIVKLRQEALKNGSRVLRIEFEAESDILLNYFHKRHSDYAYRGTIKENQWGRKPIKKEHFECFEIDVSQEKHVQAIWSMAAAQEGRHLGSSIQNAISDIEKFLPTYSSWQAALKSRGIDTGAFYEESLFHASQWKKITKLSIKDRHFVVKENDRRIDSGEIIEEVLGMHFLRELQLKHMQVPELIAFGKNESVAFVIKSHISGKTLMELFQETAQSLSSTQRKRLFQNAKCACFAAGQALGELQTKGLVFEAKATKIITENMCADFEEVLQETIECLSEIDMQALNLHKEHLRLLQTEFVKAPGAVSYGLCDIKGTQFAWDPSRSQPFGYFDNQAVTWSITNAGLPQTLVQEEFARFDSTLNAGSLAMGLLPNEVKEIRQSFSKGYASEFKGWHSAASQSFFELFGVLEAIKDLAYEFKKNSVPYLKDDLIPKLVHEANAMLSSFIEQQASQSSLPSSKISAVEVSKVAPSVSLIGGKPLGNAVNASEGAVFHKITYIAEFKKDLKRLKKYRTLENDIHAFVTTQLYAFHKQGMPNGKLFRITDFKTVQTAVYKAKSVACKALKDKGSNNGIRVIYTYLPDQDEVVLLELYHKADKANEDKKRIQGFLNTLK